MTLQWRPAPAAAPYPTHCETRRVIPTRIAVAGAGIIGQAHIAALRAQPSATLSAIVDPAPAAAAQAASLGVPLYRSLEELLALDRPDAVVLATPNALHLPQALSCIAAGVATLLEKPLTPTVAQGRELVEAVRLHKARLLVGHHRAHSPIMTSAREAIASGQLGRIVTVMGSATFYKPDQYFEDGPWRREAGGGPILINMIHEVHNLRMLCGEIVAVQAFASNAVRGFAVEDTVAINLRFASGALGCFMLSDTAASARSWEQTSQENKAYASYGDEDCYVIAGTRGSLSVPTLRIKAYADDAQRSWWKPFEASRLAVVREDPIARQMAHFAAVARGEQEPLVTAADGLANLVVTEAIAQAAQTGLQVTLD